jgi:hypothetical protein
MGKWARAKMVSSFEFRVSSFQFPVSKVKSLMERPMLMSDGVIGAEKWENGEEGNGFQFRNPNP